MSTTTAGTGYTGAVTWASSGGALDGYFAVTTAYTATITLTPTSGYVGVTGSIPVRSTLDQHLYSFKASSLFSF